MTELLQYEFRQSLRFQVWRRSANPRAGIGLADAKAALAQFEADLNQNVAMLVSCSLRDAVQRAEHLSNRHTMTGGHRSFDILHIATALHLGAQELLTFDQRQTRLAAAVGLKVKP